MFLHRLDPETGNVTTRKFNYGTISLVVAVKDQPGLLLLSVRSGLYLLNWTAPETGDSVLRLLSVVDIGLPDNKINDGKVDANGRLWFGTYDRNRSGLVNDTSTFYMVDQYNYANPSVVIRPVSLSNGVAFSRDNTQMYYIDTTTYNVDVFDFDVYLGRISSRRTLFSFPANNITGEPDGMTTDSDGNIWVASAGGGKVLKIDYESGKLLEEHLLPCDVVTSVMWGGANLSTLYVTSSKASSSPEQIAEQPEAGSLFAIEGTGTKGLPQNQFVFPDASTY